MEAGLILITGGMGLLVSGLLVRLGYLRFQLAAYWNSSSTLFRNLPLTQIPGGIALLLMGALVILNMSGRVAQALLSFAFIGVAMSVAFGTWPPSVSKPAWVVERERAVGARRASKAESLASALIVSVFLLVALIVLLIAIAF